MLPCDDNDHAKYFTCHLIEFSNKSEIRYHSPSFKGEVTTA